LTTTIASIGGGRQRLTFLLEHQPAHAPGHATREDPHLPLAQLRASDRLTELRAADLRFTASEAAEFLNNAMGLNLSAEDIAALEARTEGWIAGLQLAALSMQRGQDPSGFIRSFSGSHRFILDYLVEEVLGRQPESLQTFLLRTSILERMCRCARPCAGGQRRRRSPSSFSSAPTCSSCRWTTRGTGTATTISSPTC
jgi:LuxR family maltose regulon positive regulatory protein